MRPRGRNSRFLVEPESDAAIALLHVDRHAEAGLLLEGEAEVRAALLLELLLAALGADRLHERYRVVGGERGQVERPEPAVEADGGGDPHGEMEVARVLVDHELKELVQFNRHAALLFGKGRPGLA